MRSRPKRIGLLGNFGIGNFGNDASLEAMLLLLRQTQPNAELTCVCTNPEKVQRDFQIAAVPLSWPGSRLLSKPANWIYAIKTVSRFDMLIVPGTGILTDYCAPPFGMPYTIFRWCLAARMCGTRIGMVSVGAGPLHHPISRWFIKSTASMAQYRSFRNKFSKEFLANLGVNTKNDPIYPDIAFGLPSPSSPIKETPEVERLTVAVGAMLYEGWRGHTRTDDRVYEEHVGRILEFVLWLLDQNHRVLLITGDEKDWQAVDDVRKAVAAKRPSLPAERLIAEPAHSGHDVMRQIADADIVTASRYHHLVFALKLGKPTISTGYSEYHAELLAEMGLGAFCQHSEHINVELLITQFAKLLSNKSYHEMAIHDAMATNQKRIARQDSLFTSQFLEASPHERSESVLPDRTG